MKTTRSLTLTGELLRGYSRRGNFHSEPDEARRIGLPGLVAQGMQAAGPAYSIALDAWGDDFLAQGAVELKFVGMVTEDESIDASVDVEGDRATVAVTNRDTGAVAVVGSLRRRA